tara:strand:+ start:987 stop:1328 length:342 start_codon:yes stop_codon:yes gene_type:complete
MSVSRYINREFFLNDEKNYKQNLKKRNTSGIVQFSTAFFPEITEDEYGSIETVQHVWKFGDRYSKLAQTYYDDPTMWWVIALFNRKPTESHLELGDFIYIPVPLEAAMEIIGV